MTESVTPPKERLVDPETGETPPLSPPRMRKTNDYEVSPIWPWSREWADYETALRYHLESSDAA